MRNLWELFQIGPLRNPIRIQVDSPIVSNSSYVYISFSLFQSVIKCALSVTGETPVVLEATSFLCCLDPSDNGCFLIDINKTAYVALLKCCFVNCTAPYHGTGSIIVKNRIVTVAQCAITGINNPNQYDTFDITNGVHQIESLNSTGNNVQNCPSIATGYGSLCSYRMMIAENNNSTNGVCYFAYENVGVFMCSFINCKISNPNGHGIFSLDNTNLIATQYDIINNLGPVLIMSGSSCTLNNCFLNGNQILPINGYNSIGDAIEKNVLNIWKITAEGCHYLNLITMRCM